MTTTYPFTEEGLDAAFAALGDRAGAIADRLVELGVKGKPGDDTCCALANYLKTAIEGVTFASVGDALVDLRRAGFEDGEPVVAYLEADTPDAAADFIYVFDAREYPDLIEEAA